jgi:hypothetical protein
VQAAADAAIVHPVAGGIYWTPADPTPPAVETTEGTCEHAIPNGERRCFCGCVRLPPMSWTTRLVAVRPEVVRVRGEYGAAQRRADALVLQVEDEGVAAVLAETHPDRVEWDAWTCGAVGVDDPPHAGLWVWTGTATLGWEDDDPDRYADAIAEEWRWEGEWREVSWSTVLAGGPKP